MFDLEKFQKGDCFVHLPTQEIYDEAMKFLEENGISWYLTKATNKQIWERYKEETAINFKEHILYADKPYYEEEGFKELELNINKTNLHIGDEVIVKVDRSEFKEGQVGYISDIKYGLSHPYLVVNEKTLNYEYYGYFKISELEKLYSHEEVKEQLGLGNNEKHYTKLMLENKSIYLDKNEKYGDAFAETIQKYGYISALTRMNDKFNRIEEFTLKGFEDEEESLRDSLMDLANYCYMYVMEIDKEKEGKNE